jgi:hypothetical protein
MWYQPTGDWQVAFSDGSKFTPQPGRGDGHWLIPWAQGATSWVPLIGDVNADHRSDIVVWYPNTGDWQVAASDGFEFVPQPGTGNGHWLYGWARSWSWTAFVGDFNGDAKSDVLVWYRDSGGWQVAFSDSSKFVPQPGAGNGHWLLGWAQVAPPVLN